MEDAAIWSDSDRHTLVGGPRGDVDAVQGSRPSEVSTSGASREIHRPALPLGTHCRAGPRRGQGAVGQRRGHSRGQQSASNNSRDICQAQAKGKEQVALAEIGYGQTAKQTEAAKVALARADGDFGVAKERCDDLAGQPKSLCITEAKATYTKAQADAINSSVRSPT